MKNKELLAKLGALGFGLMAPETDADVNNTLAELVQSEDVRLWEGFPVVLANSAGQGNFNYAAVLGLLKSAALKDRFYSLTLVALALYKSFRLEFAWAEKLGRALPAGTTDGVGLYTKKLSHDEDVSVGEHTLSSQRLKTTFHNYFVQAQTHLHNLLEVKDGLSLEYSLSQLFSPKQKELLFKKVRREKLTKTEREYFSRVVRKKLLAVANPEVLRLAQNVLY